MLSCGGISMRQQIQLGQFAQFTIDVPAPLKPIREKQRGAFGLSPEARWCSYTNRRTRVHKKRQLTTPSCRFPLQAGGTEPLRGSPREAGGTYGGGQL
jgi:hypothetical protein